MTTPDERNRKKKMMKKYTDFRCNVNDNMLIETAMMATEMVTIINIITIITITSVISMRHIISKSYTKILIIKKALYPVIKIGTKVK